MKLLFLLFTVLNAHLVVGQQYSISGTVTDDMGPVEFVTIEVEGLGDGVITDSNGVYKLILSPGQYHIKASFVGCIPVKKKVIVGTSDLGDVDFHMNSNTQLEEVVVSGTMKSTYVSDSPVKIDVISAKQLEVYIPAASASVVEGITMINGVEEVVACGVCFTNSISINGLPGQYTAILMDGMPMYGNLASVYGLNGIPNMIIDRFEVIKGPSSTLYGSEAVAGVLNIITKDPGNQPLVEVDIMGTSHMESFGNVAIAPRIGKSTGYVGLNYAYINDYDDTNSDGFGDGANLDRLSLFTKWNIARASGKKFSVAAKYYREDRRNGVEQYVKDRNYRELRGSAEIYGESIYTRRAEVFGSYEFAGVQGLRLDFSGSTHDQDSYYGTDHYVADQQIAFSNLNWNVVKGKHDVTSGLTLRYQSYDDNTVATQQVEGTDTINKPDNQFIPGIFVQDEWSISERWTLLPGLRLDYYSAHGLIPAPRLSAKYKVSDWTTSRINLGTGFRIVNLFTEDHAFITGQREVIIEGALRPERSVSGAINLNHIFTLGRSSGSIDVDAHYTYFSNKIVPDYSVPGEIRYGNSTGSAKTMGIASTLSLNFAAPLGIQLGFNAQRAVQTEEDDKGILQASNIEFSPRFTGLFTANYRWDKIDLVAAYTMRLTGPMSLPIVYDLDESGAPKSDPRPGQSSPYSIHNIQVTKRLGKKWSIYGGVQNLFDQRQEYSPLIGYDDPNAAPGFSDYFDTAYAYGTLHGRELYIGVKFNTGTK